MTTKKKLRLPKKYIKHFESHGYDVDLESFDMGGIDWIACEHELFGNTLAAITPNEIVMFRCMIRLIKKADKKRDLDLLKGTFKIKKHSHWSSSG